MTQNIDPLVILTLLIFSGVSILIIFISIKYNEHDIIISDSVRLFLYIVAILVLVVQFVFILLAFRDYSLVSHAVVILFLYFPALALGKYHYTKYSKIFNVAIISFFFAILFFGVSIAFMAFPSGTFLRKPTVFEYSYSWGFFIYIFSSFFLFFLIKRMVGAFSLTAGEFVSKSAQFSFIASLFCILDYLIVTIFRYRFNPFYIFFISSVILLSLTAFLTLCVLFQDIYKKT